MDIVIRTERLYLRKFTDQDADLIYQLNLDPEVTRFTHDPVRDLQHAEDILFNTILPRYALNNHGRWATYLKSTDEFIGWCGLKFRPERNETDLGYRFIKDYWGKGYAFESAFASITYGFKVLKKKRIVGGAEPANIASWKVLEKCGMTYIGEDIVDGYPAKTYEIINPLIP